MLNTVHHCLLCAHFCPMTNKMNCLYFLAATLSIILPRKPFYIACESCDSMWIMGHYDANDQQQCRFIDKALLLLQITNIIKPENFCTSCNMSHCTVLNCLILFSFWQIRALFFWFSSHLLVSKNNPHRSAGTESSLECIFSHQLYYFI